MQTFLVIPKALHQKMPRLRFRRKSTGLEIESHLQCEMDAVVFASLIDHSSGEIGGMMTRILPLSTNADQEAIGEYGDGQCALEMLDLLELVKCLIIIYGAIDSIKFRTIVIIFQLLLCPERQQCTSINVWQDFARQIEMCDAHHLG